MCFLLWNIVERWKMFGTFVIIAISIKRIRINGLNFIGQFAAQFHVDDEFTNFNKHNRKTALLRRRWERSVQMEILIVKKLKYSWNRMLRRTNLWQFSFHMYETWFHAFPMKPRCDEELSKKKQKSASSFNNCSFWIFVQNHFYISLIKRISATMCSQNSRVSLAFFFVVFACLELCSSFGPRARVLSDKSWYAINNNNNNNDNIRKERYMVVWVLE